MVISMIQFVLELPEITSIKDKRRIVNSIKGKLISRYKISMAEVDLLHSLSFAQLGGAVVSNSKEHGESVMQKVLQFVEKDLPGMLTEVSISSEQF